MKWCVRNNQDCWSITISWMWRMAAAYFANENDFQLNERLDEATFSEWEFTLLLWCEGFMAVINAFLLMHWVIDTSLALKIGRYL